MVKECNKLKRVLKADQANLVDSTNLFDLLNIIATMRTNHPLYEHDVWYLDSGATGYMMCDCSWLYNYRAIEPWPILLGNNNTIYI